MVSVTLASSLAAYLPADNGAGSGGRRTITVSAETWPETVQEIRTRYRRLGDHLFESSGKLRAGFLVAINDEVDRRPDRISRLGTGDSVFVFTQIAGG